MGIKQVTKLVETVEVTGGKNMLPFFLALIAEKSIDYAQINEGLEALVSFR
jgi:hypothetical protein